VAGASLKMAKCGHWDTTFVKLIHREADTVSDGGPEALDALTKQGYDVEKQFMAFLDRHADKPLAFEHANYVARNVTQWMQKNRPADRCNALVPYVAKMESSPQFAFYDYFVETPRCAPSPAATTPST
jgi:hypothetical protein